MMSEGKDARADRGGDGQEHREFDGAVLAPARARAVIRAETARKLRQEDDADGDANDGERQLIDAVGVIEPGHRARLQRGDHGADGEVHLRDAARDDAGDTEAKEAA